MHDTRLEERLHQVLRAEGDSLPLTLTAGQLEQRLRLRRSERANRRLILATAAALVVAVGAGGGFLLSNRGPTPPVAASPSPSAVPASPVASPSYYLVPVDAIAPYLGWQTLGRLSGPDDDSKGSLIAQRPSEVTVLLISAACSGSGSLAITVAGTGDQLNVDCPVASTEPTRTLASAGDATELTVDVTATGAVSFQVIVEGSNAPLAIPTVVLRHGTDEAALAYGCGGIISLAWGYEAGDSCATTVPVTPLEMLELVEGDAATVAIDGWTITEASATCGRIVSESGSPDVFEAMSQCAVAATLTDSTITVSRIPKAPNAWVLELSFTARNPAGDSFSGPNYMYIHVR